MTTKLKIFNKSQLKEGLLDIRPGDTVRVFQKAVAKAPEKGKPTENKKKQKVQTFEGLVIARKHGKGISATITVRKMISEIGVERIFPVHSPAIEKIEILSRAKVKRSKLYYLREVKGKKARLKKKEFVQAVAPKEPVVVEEEPTEIIAEESENIGKAEENKEAEKGQKESNSEE
ncbi:50S ribosomal protein L19 [Patescibacteria group bacterium]|nr:50S ribosomal protein L19 [Patescibacteria group bacterium]